MLCNAHILTYIHTDRQREGDRDISSLLLWLTICPGKPLHCAINHSLGTQCSILWEVEPVSTVLYECVRGKGDNVILEG